MAKKMGRPTCFDASSTAAKISVAVSAPPFLDVAASQCRMTFSVITIAASTSTPMAMAMPDRLMMFDVNPNCLIRMNEMRMLTGSGSITMRMLRK